MGVAFKDEEYNTVKEFLSKPGDNGALQDAGILGLCTDSSLVMDVVGQSKFEYIKLAPFLVVRILQISTLPKNVKYNLIPGIGGASGSMHEANAVLSPNQDKLTAAILVPAPDLLADQNKSVADFFTLSPGEREVFQLIISSQPGYIYTYQVGVYYSYKGSKHVKWIDKTFTSDGITNEMNEMKVVNSALKVTGEIQLVPQTVDEEYSNRIQEIRDKVRKEPFFILSDINK
jgi:hypothetical protein